ncbi:MAG: Fe(2+)-trafficking protein [Phycisphaerales bacterium JB037]
MNIEDRIAQFEKMAREDAENDMAHFSLGNAYNQAGRYEEAAESFKRCVELNPAMSKAYQLAGAAYMAAMKTDEAGEILTRGYVAAAERGDLMPRDAIAELLGKLDLPVPEVKAKKVGPAPDGSFICKRTGRPGTEMKRPPFRGPVGEWIRANIAKETFDDWIAQGTKVINELRLDLSREQDEVVYDAHMREYLGLDDATYEQLTGEKPPRVGA